MERLIEAAKTEIDGEWALHVQVTNVQRKACMCMQRHVHQRVFISMS
jgi:hypothetical protein